MWKQFTVQGNTVYFDILPKILSQYNNTKHLNTFKKTIVTDPIVEKILEMIAKAGTGKLDFGLKKITKIYQISKLQARATQQPK